MKTYKSWLVWMGVSILTLFCSVAYAGEVKVISRMSYYTTEEKAEILVCLPEGEGSLPYTLAKLDGQIVSLHKGVNVLSLPASSLKQGNHLYGDAGR